MDEPGGLPLNTPPKLTMVSIDADKELARNTADSNDTLKHFIEGLAKNMHPQGTVAFAVPRPWLEHGHRIRGSVLNPCALRMTYASIMLHFQR